MLNKGKIPQPSDPYRRSFCFPLKLCFDPAVLTAPDLKQLSLYIKRSFDIKLFSGVSLFVLFQLYRRYNRIYQSQNNNGYNNIKYPFQLS